MEHLSILKVSRTPYETTICDSSNCAGGGSCQKCGGGNCGKCGGGKCAGYTSDNSESDSQA